MKIKICGITNQQDALDAVSLGADALGFIFYSKSPRYVNTSTVKEIVISLPPFIQCVGVFVNHSKEEITSIVDECQLDTIQLHGDESHHFCSSMPKRVIKTFRVGDINDIASIKDYKEHVSAVLLDTKCEGAYGGTGQTFDWSIALKAKEMGLPVILSGGLTEENLKEAMATVNPYAVDVSSGVEKEPGKKDISKLRSVIDLVHENYMV